MDETTRRRVDKIVSALQDVAVRFPEPHLAIYPLFDALQLLLQRPVVWSLVEGDETADTCKLMFTTMRDPELLKDFERAVLCSLTRITTLKTEMVWFPIPDPDCVDPPGRVVLLCAHLMQKGEDAATIEFARLGTRDKELVEALLVAMSHAGSPGGKERTLSETLAKIVRHARTPHAPLSVVRPVLANPRTFRSEDDHHRDRFKRYMRPIVDQTTRDIGANLLLRGKSGKPTNLFFVVRRAIDEARYDKGGFQYTAQLVLSTEQNDLARNAGCVEAIEQPLGPTCRSIADSVFAGGVADFVLEQLKDSPESFTRDAGGDQVDEARRAAERAFIANPMGPNLLYVPVHVGGVIWAGMFTCSKEDKNSNAEEIWQHNYHFYRVLVPQLSERFRLNARNSYFELLLRAFEEVLSAQKNTAREFASVEAINKRWSELARYFPFDLMALRFDDGSKVEGPRVSLPKGAVVLIEASPNPFPAFAPLVEFDRIRDDDLEKFEERLTEIAARTGKANFEAALAEIAHDGVSANLLDPFVNALRLQDWEYVAVISGHGNLQKELLAYHRVLDDAGKEEWRPGDPTAAGSEEYREVRPFVDFAEGPDAISVTPDERSEHADIRFVFGFPPWVHKPHEDAKDELSRRQKIMDELIRHQRIILNLLIPRVRARRYAIQTAAAAIMSRNMSHNIGSNPLTREVDRITLEAEQRNAQTGRAPGGRREDGGATELLERATFLTYLRDRMDYLAEITTSEPVWGTVANVGVLCDRFRKQTVLLRGLTGLGICGLKLDDSTLASMMFLPHGTLGAQALYAIFENMLRNSVQHGTKKKMVAIRDGYTSPRRRSRIISCSRSRILGGPGACRARGVQRKSEESFRTASISRSSAMMDPFLLKIGD